jgi:hypothetical protein
MLANNRFAVLMEPLGRVEVNITTCDDLYRLVTGSEPKTVTVTWRNVTNPERITTRPIRAIKSMKPLPRGMYITVAISRRRFRSFYLHTLISVTVEIQ